MRIYSLGAVVPVAVLCFLAGCESDESTGETSHTPDEVVITVDGVEVDTLRLTQAGTTRVVLKFYHDGESIDDNRGGHHSRLVFAAADPRDRRAGGWRQLLA